MEALIIPGFGCNAKRFARTAERLSRGGLSARALTLPGHQPGGDPSGKTLDDYVDFVKNEIESDETILIGHSMGGLIAQLVAEEDEYVIGQVLLASVVRGALLSLRVLQRLARSEYLMPVFTGGALTLRKDDVQALFLDEESPADLWASFGKESGAVLRDIVRLQLQDRPPPTRQIRTLVVEAEHDRVISHRSQEKLARSYGVPLQTIRGAGHMLGEYPWHFLVEATILQWVSGEFPHQRIPYAAA